MRAVDYEESGRWSDAERDLQRALLMRPDEPELLNFLGYSWIDRGEKLHPGAGDGRRRRSTSIRSRGR